MHKILICLLIGLIISCQPAKDSKQPVNITEETATVNQNNDKLQWWRDARFGMFIHWGLYSQCEGFWKGKPVQGIGEWVFKNGKVPVKDYHKLTETFTAEHLNVENWVKLAKEAGMKYVVITTKHHDGFALFKSEVDSFNVVDATPYGKDVIRQFVDACNKYDLKIGFYYSQFQDWSVAGAGGNDWEEGYQFTKEGFEKYMNEKALPQVREILTNYGKIDMLWYDTPGKMTKEQSESFLNLAKELQPDILVSGRVGNGVGDYIQMEDNNLPKRRQDFDWEVPVTMNHTWAYKRDDHHWKSTNYLLWQLTYSVAMNGNYLLNIGPKADGTVPKASLERLQQIAKWMKVNKEAVEKAKPSPFINEFNWGSITSKGNQLYLNIADYPKNHQLAIYGLKTAVNKAYTLDGHKEISFHKNEDYLIIDLPKEPINPYISVVVLELDGKAEVDNTLVQKHNKHIILETEVAENTTGATPHFGSLKKWFKPKGELKWSFKVTAPSKFKVQVITTGFKRMAYPERPALFDDGHLVEVTVNGQVIKGEVKVDKIEKAPKDLYNDFKVTDLGEIEITKTGMMDLTFKALKINKKNKAGLAIRQVRLIPLGEETALR